MSKRQTWDATGGQLVLLFILSVMAAPVEFLAHEGAHFVAARGFGVAATLHFDQVDLPGAERLGHLQRLLIAAAGPAVDWIVGLAGVLLVAARFTPMRLVLAIWVARPLQFLPSVLGVGVDYLGLGGSLQGSDEVTMARTLSLRDHGIVWLCLLYTSPSPRD